MKLRKVEVDRPFLKEEDIQKIMSYNSNCERLNRIRIFFYIFMFTGLAYIDIHKLKKSEVKFCIDAYWINNRRKKLM